LLNDEEFAFVIQSMDEAASNYNTACSKVFNNINQYRNEKSGIFRSGVRKIVSEYLHNNAKRKTNSSFDIELSDLSEGSFMFHSRIFININLKENLKLLI